MHPTRRAILVFAAAVPAAAIFSSPSLAVTTAIYANDGIAIDGSDAVAYFTQGQPVVGEPTLTYNWMGMTWQFSTEENRAAFASGPEAYAPQYGGYCANTVGEGYTASTTPEAWKIVDGKLYLNYSRRIQRRWERDIPGRIALADANWRYLLSEVRLS